jgi:V/A-type H+-transporting ATPase subunit E
MINETQIKELEHALMSRAHALADQYRERGRQQRDRILVETEERLHQREEQETTAAKTQADRVYQRQVQAGELKLQADMDRLRWALVQSVIESAKQELEALARDEARYDALLGAFLAQAVDSIEADELVAYLNRRDQQRLAGRWTDWVAQWSSGKPVELGPEPLDSIGGLLIESKAGDIRIDHSFEGRLARLYEDIQQAVSERLFASLPESGALFNG